MTERAEVRFRWAGMGVGLRDLSPAVLERFASGWPEFLSGHPPDCWISAAPGAGSSSGFLSVLPEARALPDGGLEIETALFRATISPDRARVRMDGVAGVETIDPVLKLLLSEAVLHRGGLLVHGVAVAHAGRVAVLVGESGAGKSTLGALCAGAGLQVLADELVAITPRGLRRWAEGTPWNVGCPGEGELVLWGTLAHAASAWWEPISQSELIRTLLSNVLLADRSPAGRARAFRAAGRLVPGLPTRRLCFARSPEVAELVRQALEDR